MRFAMYDTSLEPRIGEYQIIKRFLIFPCRIDGKMTWWKHVYVKQQVQVVEINPIATYNRNPDWVDVCYVKENDYVDFERNKIKESSSGN